MLAPWSRIRCSVRGARFLGGAVGRDQGPGKVNVTGVINGTPESVTLRS